MSTIWSSVIQTSGELYRSRALRFTLRNQAAWVSAFGIQKGMRILEVGCGPGLLSYRIAECCPDTEIVGMDMDAGHLAYAREKAEELGLSCQFVEGDARPLPFADGQFDLTISYTVMEHVETNAFLQEQRRVLKPGGRTTAACVYPRHNIAQNMEWMQPDPEEAALWKKLWADAEDLDAKHGVARYALDMPQRREAFLQNGFVDIIEDFRMLRPYAPDSADVPTEEAMASIEDLRRSQYDQLARGLRQNPTALSDQEVAALRECIETRFAARTQKYQEKQPVWNVMTSLLHVLSGKKTDC